MCQASYRNSEERLAGIGWDKQAGRTVTKGREDMGHCADLGLFPCVNGQSRQSFEQRREVI